MLYLNFLGRPGEKARSYSSGNNGQIYERLHTYRSDHFPHHDLPAVFWNSRRNTTELWWNFNFHSQNGWFLAKNSRRKSSLFGFKTHWNCTLKESFNLTNKWIFLIFILLFLMNFATIYPKKPLGILDLSFYKFKRENLTLYDKSFLKN